ncbi:MAG: NifB/NifX family molybdenum-iron cluster-binding protein [Sphaerochaetaceae bacterium]|jgi:predicted Fe-Mo cluster-binding NifX family protein
MKLALPADSNTLDSKICVSFGRSPYFCFYNTVDKTSTFIRNPAAQSEGGAGIKAAQILVDHQVEALLTLRCGENAAQVLTAANSKVYKALDASLTDNIAAFEQNTLVPLTHFHAGFHGHA